MANGTNGYRFVGWCREPSVTVNEVAEDPAYFEPMVTGDWVSDSPVYEASNADPANRQFEDNDLFIASYQAQVLFHDVDGNVINKGTGAADPNTDDDWYDYFDPLPSPSPAKPPKARPSSAGRRQRTRQRRWLQWHNIHRARCDRQQRGVVQSE